MSNVYEKPVIPTSSGKVTVKQLQQHQPLLEVNMSTFAFLFSELVQYSQKRVTGIPQLEHKLGQLGHQVGVRHLEMCGYKDLMSQLNCSTSVSSLTSSTTSGAQLVSSVSKSISPLLTKQSQQSSQTQTQKGHKQIVQILMYITQTLWRSLFGRPADSLEKSSSSAQEYMIIDNEPLVNKFISIPRDLQQLNCGAFVAGIVEAYLTSMVQWTGVVCRCTAHSTPTPTEPLKTTYLINFDNLQLSE